MADPTIPRDMRAGVVESVRLDLLGPVQEDEILFDYRVRDRYLLGMLATDGAVAVDAAMSGGDGPDEGRKAIEASNDDDSGSKPMLFPSSMGLSFAVEPGVDQVEVEVSWGEYAKVDNPIAVAERPDWQTTDRFKRVWQRTPRVEQRSVALEDARVTTPDLHGQHGPLRLTGTVRTAPTGCRLVTLFLHNKQVEPSKSGDEAWVFQPQLVVTTQGNEPVFVGRAQAMGITPPDETIDSDAAERARLDMQYRGRVEFARGHAVSVTATPRAEDPVRTDRIATTFFPQHEIRRTAPASPADRNELDGLVTDMTRLADMPVDDLREGLLPLAVGYAEWLAQQAYRVDSEPGLSPHTQAAEDALYDAGQVANAIKEGIDLLVDGSDALAAFRFANAAMAEQRLRSDAIRARREDGDERDLDHIIERMRVKVGEGGENPHTRWRPFQLAFVLLNLPALVDPTHESRSSDNATVDLLFFPTGGGKTEAYLGLVAVTFAARRLQPSLGDVDASDGVAVIMRYTLRLLTAQQFERAAALVCATEVIRRENPDRWGPVPFRLGMWVGGSLTPNSSGTPMSGGERKGAARAIHYLRQGRKPYEGSPHQLDACPWCGTDLDPTADPRHIFAADDDGSDAARHNPDQRTVTYCPDEVCDFGKADSPGEGIPVVTVDDEIYRLLPTFIIGTIDKFAQLPWNPNVRMLFGRVSERCPSHGWRGPDASYWPEECHSKTGHTSIKTVPADQVIEGSLGRLRPPDLVIQDEFHLITGPLGTLAGLYETAIDDLSVWKLGDTAIRSKVLASTATIRRAGDQARAVFARSTRVFPPQVLDVDDNFFSYETDLEQSAGRLYVGICASGRRLKEAESRLFRTAMAAAQHQWDLAEEYVVPGQTNPADPWMTTVGYFGSIRELAGMNRIAGEELISRLRGIESDRRAFLGTRGARAFRLPDGSSQRLYYELDHLELTSRVGATDLRETLGELFTPHRYDVVENPRRKIGWEVQRRGIDLVLATNMISVGVDVSRLGMMIVVGQPKTTAEYIQASSRVGRDYTDAPGVVFTLQSWARPRDLSHWEQFEHYHDTFYRNVEAQSVTPFAPRALDRGATGVLVSLLRGHHDAWATDRGLASISPGAAGLSDTIDAISGRAAAASATADQVDAARDAAEVRVGKLVEKLTEAHATYAWRAKGPGSKKENLVTLLHMPEDDAVTAHQPWVMPNSLRNTEAGINVLIDRSFNPPGEPDWVWGTNTGQSPGTAAPSLGILDDVEDAEEEAAISDALTGEGPDGN